MRNTIMKRKMCRFVTIFCLSILFFSLTITAHASLVTVTEGRALLFNGGNLTYSGILSANEKFKAAVEANPSDQEANLFYALTRLLAFGLENGTGLTTARDLFEAFGISRNDVDLVEEDSPYNDPPEIYGHYDPPEIIPGGEDVRAFWAGPFVTLLDAAIANLNQVQSTFTTILITDETGDDYDIEVDYGDVLIFKSALYTLKSAILIMTAYDLDIAFRELTVLGNAGVLQIQRDLLNKYSSLLNLRTADGADSLTNAKTALLDGITAYSDAFTFITGGSDDRIDELFYFDSDEDQREAEFILTQLTELKNSLNENRAALFTTIDETWIFTDTTTNNQLKLSIEKDVNEKFVWGDYCGLNGCDFISCGGWVESISIVSGSQSVITLAYDGMYSGSATFTGTTNADGTHIDGTYTEYNDLGVETGSGSFTATRQSQETETETIDFNLIFGNSGKFPLDIRAILPQFDQYNEPIPGTFGTPILNGIVPELATNDDLTREMNLQPSGFFTIPTVVNGEISMDGSLSDWPTTSALAFTDIVNDENEDADFLGTDIHKFYLAKDSTYLYIGMELYDGAPKADNASGYVFQANQSHDRHSTPGDRIASVWYHDGVWVPNVGERTWLEQQPIQINSYPSNYAAAGSKFIEWKVLLDDMGNLSGRFVNAYSHFMGSYDYIIYPLSDSNLTAIMLDTTSISGTITCTAHNGTGNLFIGAYDGSNPNTANELGSAYISAPGSYEITGLPVGANVYIFACWDADDNGIRTFGDYVGKTAEPVTVASGETAGVNLSVDTLLGFSGQEKVYPLKRGDKGDEIYLGFWAQIPDAQSVSVSGPGISAPISLGRNPLYPWWSGGIPVSELGGEIQAGTYTFQATPSGGGTVVSTTFTLASVPSTPEPAVLVSPYDGSPDVEMTLGTTTPTFTWNAASGAQAHKLRIDQEIDGNWSWIYDSGWGITGNTHTVETPLPTGVHLRWYVDAYDGADWDSTTAMSRSVKQKFTISASGSVIKGDLNGDTNVTLADAILGLKVMAGMNPTGIRPNYATSGVDVNGDNEISLAEVIYILQYVAGLRD